MPGASLWLIPPEFSPFNSTLQHLITTTIPSHFPSATTHDFIPHITLTSNISSSLYTSDPQNWLNNLSLPQASTSDPLILALELLETGNQFVKKLTIRAGKSSSLVKLAGACRAGAVAEGDVEGAKKWAKEEYLPHLSLMYADIPTTSVSPHLTTLATSCQEAGRSLPASDQGTVCTGGSIVLVDTSKPVSEWTAIATRELSSSYFLWSWPWSRSRFDD